MSGEGRVDYSAYFRDPLQAADGRVQEMLAWAEGRGLRARLVASGRPFLGMNATLELGVVSETIADAFRQAFRPDHESAIPSL